MTKVVSIPFMFDAIKFRNDIVAFHDAHNLRYDEMDVLFDLPVGNCARLSRGDFHNPKMNTWLKVANGMDVDVRTYFVLES